MIGAFGRSLTVTNEHKTEIIVMTTLSNRTADWCTPLNGQRENAILACGTSLARFFQAVCLRTTESDFRANQAPEILGRPSHY